MSGVTTLMISEICGVSSLAATRGRMFFPLVVADARMASYLPARERMSVSMVSASGLR